MRKQLILIAILTLVCNPVFAGAKALQERSVTVRTRFSRGSGTLILRSVDGVKKAFVLTAAHAVDDLRETKTITRGGKKHIKVSFRDAQIVRVVVEKGKEVEERVAKAKVIRFSKAHDLALLMVRSSSFAKVGVSLWPDDNVPETDTDVIHVGSMLGDIGHNSVTRGIISQVGRILRDSDEHEYDQTDAAILPGSSGGGMFDEKTKRYIGMVVRGAAGGFGLYVPIRRIRRWAKEAGIEWALRDEGATTSKALRKLPPE